MPPAFKFFRNIIVFFISVMSPSTLYLFHYLLTSNSTVLIAMSLSQFPICCVMKLHPLTLAFFQTRVYSHSLYLSFLLHLFTSFQYSSLLSVGFLVFVYIIFLTFLLRTLSSTFSSLHSSLFSGRFSLSLKTLNLVNQLSEIFLPPYYTHFHNLYLLCYTTLWQLLLMHSNYLIVILTFFFMGSLSFSFNI